MDKELFQGTWKLISTKYTSDDGEIVYPLGSKVSGQLIYDNKGNMSAQLYNVKRPKFASEDWKRGTLLEIKAAFESFRSYYGTYDVDEEKKVVTHHVLGQ